MTQNSRKNFKNRIKIEKNNDERGKNLLLWTYKVENRFKKKKETLKKLHAKFLKNKSHQEQNLFYSVTLLKSDSF